MTKYLLGSPAAMRLELPWDPPDEPESRPVDPEPEPDLPNPDECDRAADAYFGQRNQ